MEVSPKLLETKMCLRSPIKSYSGGMAKATRQNPQSLEALQFLHGLTLLKGRISTIAPIRIAP